MEERNFSIGVEEEYQLVDPASGALRSRARDVLEADWGSELRPEIQQTMLEVGTRVCGSARELGEELRRLRFYVGSAAAAQDLAFVAAGVHPFSRWEDQLSTEGERYRAVRERLGRVIRSEHVFGMHVHVAVPEGVDRIPLLGCLRRFLPHLLALAASSPRFEGEDTGYASYRTILVGRLPHSGIPPRLASEAEYRRYLDLLLRSGVLPDLKSLYWSLRPHPVYPTLEFRATDVCPRVEDAIAIAAFTRALVVAAAEGLLSEPGSEFSPAAEDALLAANEWQAARFGLQAVLADPERPGGGEPLRDAVARLVERVVAVAERLGDGAELAGVTRLLKDGNGADRVRRAEPACDGPAGLLRWLAAESQVGIGMDRRGEQREAPSRTE